MNNSFNCDTEISDEGILGGYYCSGTLTDITTNLSQQTRVYIRCNDQPWLEGNEDVTYQRNKNDKSTSYILRASQEFKIVDITPSGTIFLSNNQNTSVELKAYTTGGGLNGRANCKWRLSSSTNFGGISYTNFLTTGATLHKQNLTGISEGVHYIHIRCEDSSENVQDSYASFTLGIDRSSPIIAKIYEKFGNLFIKTNEKSVCYISDNKETKCSFKNENATRMSGSEEEHETEWEFDKTYFIRCKDYYGNENPNNCNMITRTY
jgi:hypothetical protein